LRDASGLPSTRNVEDFFGIIRSNSYRFWLTLMKVIFEKENSSFANIKSYLDTHLRVVHAVLIESEDVQFLGPFFLNFGSFQAQV
jgi:hypothetical protein